MQMPDTPAHQTKRNPHSCYPGDAGYLVLLPDFFHGDAIGNYTERSDFWKAHPFTESYPEVDGVLKQIRSQYGDIPVGIEGFCYGGHHAIRLAGEQLLLIVHLWYLWSCLACA